ncbi:hypothetical protein Ancab_030327 [Ancistrocladus abbreviatus]
MLALFLITHDHYILLDADDTDIVKRGCEKSFATFPKGCFYTSSRGLRSFEHLQNELKPVPGVDSSGAVCHATFKVDSKSKKGTSMPRGGSAADWSLIIDHDDYPSTEDFISKWPSICYTHQSSFVLLASLILFQGSILHSRGSSKMLRPYVMPDRGMTTHSTSIY